MFTGKKKGEGIDITHHTNASKREHNFPFSPTFSVTIRIRRYCDLKSGHCYCNLYKQAEISANHNYYHHS